MSNHEFYAIPDPMIGHQIGRYVIRRKLAEGGMGAVYLATHERLENTTKVVKILLPVYARNPILRERFEREALAVSRLRHKHIVTIDDYGQLPDGQLFLMMPFLQGQPLEAYLHERGKLTEHLALHILVQVCSALQYMHDSGVVHRDIKPANIFIVPDEDNPYRVVLIDLGIAKTLTERSGGTQTGATMGTPAYMAVEQYEDAAGVTPMADLYAVAIVAWEMVTTRLPWGMHSTHVLYKKQKEERPARPNEMSMAWFEILSAALSVHPGDRPESMRALAVALASCVPPIPPHVPSGAEILAKLAKTFVQHAPPSAETVRNGSNQERMTPIAWPHRGTPSPAATPGHEAARSTPGTRLLEPPHAAGAAPVGYLTPAIGPVPTVPTTLSASNGIAIARPTSTRWRFPLMATTVLGVGGIVAYSLTVFGGLPPAQPAATPALGSPLSPSSDAATPRDAAIPDAVPGDASLPDAASSIQEAAPSTPALDTRPPTKRSATVRTAPPPGDVTKPKPKDQRPDGRPGDDRFNRNAAGGDE